MTRVVVICGTGMSDLSKVYQNDCDLDLIKIRIDTEWGAVPISVIDMDDNKIFIEITLFIGVGVRLTFTGTLLPIIFILLYEIIVLH